MPDATLFIEEAACDGIARRVAGVAVFDGKGRVLLLRRAPWSADPGLWELPSRPVDERESPAHAAERALREVGVTDGAVSYAGHYDDASDEGLARHMVFTTRVAPIDVTLPPGHDAHVWRHADALPAVRTEVLDLVRRIAPPKHLEPDEWQHSLPRWHVGANALVRDQHGRILLVRPRRSDLFQLPGGQVDAHETPPEAAGRELHEETGLDLRVGQLLAISFEHPSPGWDHPTQILLFDLGSVDSTTSRFTTEDPDIAEHRWTHADEAEQLLGAARAERLRAGLLGLRQGHPALITNTEPEWF